MSAKNNRNSTASNLLSSSEIVWGDCHIIIRGSTKVSEEAKFSNAY